MDKFVALVDDDDKQNYTGIGVDSADDPYRKYIGDYKDGKEHGIGV